MYPGRTPGVAGIHRQVPGKSSCACRNILMKARHEPENAKRVARDLSPGYTVS